MTDDIAGPQPVPQARISVEDLLKLLSNNVIGFVEARSILAEQYDSFASARDGAVDEMYKVRGEAQGNHLRADLLESQARLDRLEQQQDD